MKKIKQLIACRPMQIIWTLLCPMVNFYLLEWFTHNPWKTMKVPIQFYNILFFELLLLFLVSILGKVKYALIIETIFTFVFGMANYYVMAFRSKPIVPWDIFSVKTAASVADNYDYSLTKTVIMVIFLTLALLLAESRISLKLPEKLPFVREDKKMVKWVIRLSLFLISCVSLWVYTSKLHQKTFISKMGYYDKLFTPDTMTFRDGTVNAFLIDLQYLTVKKPDGYSVEKAEEILAGFSDAENEKAALNEVSEDPVNVIVIMNEAFSDLAVLDQLDTNVDYMPFVHSLQAGAENTVSGYLNVSVLGGNTANTEFEFLTGNTMAFLPEGSIPYQQYIRGPIPSLVSYFNDLGYETVAMHPYHATGWNRDVVYRDFGFDRSLFEDDFTDATILRKYVDDDSCVNKIIETYENKEPGTPLFVFNVTMQNHSSYTDAYPNLTEDVFTGDEKAEVLSRYLTLIKKSDESLKKMVDYFSAKQEKTAIVFFGDHQPSDSVAKYVYSANGRNIRELTDEEKASRYEVPYIIWTNFDTAEKSSTDTSANYLGENLLTHIGMPLPAFQAFLKEEEEKYQVLSAQKIQLPDGTRVEASDAEASLNDYRILQYYYLFDYEEN
ncbi:MAG: LTA synthase family protein [Lachnospiraceae bacterium]|nr:LTA synthase family protein [Lachnospiraceae bacterium]